MLCNARKLLCIETLLRLLPSIYHKTKINQEKISILLSRINSRFILSYEILVNIFIKFSSLNRIRCLTKEKASQTSLKREINIHFIHNIYLF